MWIAAITLGLAGSLHCAGMCSPLAMMITGNKVTYNIGRILTYALLGAIAGSVGTLIGFTGFQKYLSISLGVLLIVFGVCNIRIAAMNKIVIYLKTFFSAFIKRRNLFLLGMLNGLLPCGLTYIALTFAMTLNPLDGFLYMLTFGSATLPVMLGLTTVLSKQTFRFRNLTTILMIALGLLLIARPFFSHSQHTEPTTEVICK